MLTGRRPDPFAGMYEYLPDRNVQGSLAYPGPEPVRSN
jgi:hypothetical protein